MSGIFLSYSRVDRELALTVVRNLRRLAVQVWWDEDMSGVEWQEELRERIHSLAAVVVLWTPTSINSKNVRDEARLAQHEEKLINALGGVRAPPFPFDRTNGLPLDGWNEREPHSGWARLAQTIEDFLVAAGSADAGQIAATLAQREATVREARVRVQAAERAIAAAEADQDRTAQASKAAALAVTNAEEQQRQVVEIRASVALRRAAQTELDDAVVALRAADAEHRIWADNVATTTRLLSEARAQLDGLFGDPPFPAITPRAPPRRKPEEIAPQSSEPAAPARVTLAAAPPHQEAAAPLVDVEPRREGASLSTAEKTPAQRPPAPPALALSPSPAPRVREELFPGLFAKRTDAKPAPPQRSAPPNNGADGAAPSRKREELFPGLFDSLSAQQRSVRGRVIVGVLGAFAGIAAVWISMAIISANGRFNDLKTRAGAGDAEAQYELGEMYSNGSFPAPRDSAIAFGWLQKSANQGYSEAYVKLGEAYLWGFGIDQDASQAASWFLKALSDPAVHDTACIDLHYVPSAQAEDLARAGEPASCANVQYLWATNSAATNAAP